MAGLPMALRRRGKKAPLSGRKSAGTGPQNLIWSAGDPLTEN